MRDSIDLVIPAYNVADVIGPTLDHIARQEVPADRMFNVFVSDDGSTDKTPDVLESLCSRHSFLNVIATRTNGGRSQACNHAAAAGSGEIIIICDADCRYTRADALVQFAAEIESGADAVIGQIELPGHGFWARYTNAVAAERLGDRNLKGLAAFSTGNFAIRRQAYEDLGGFSQDYRHYGFEDKDFLIRLERSKRKVAIRPDICVNHADDMTLAAACRKFCEAGRHSAALFRERFPVEYEALAYVRCDAASGGRLRRTLRTASGPISIAARLAAGLALKVPVGFPTKRALVRLALCAAYFHGTASR